MPAVRLNRNLLFKDDQSSEALLPSTETEKDYELAEPNAKLSLSLSSLIIIVLVVVNAGLAYANIQTTRSIASQTLAIIPAQNVEDLYKPDQYDGLSEASRLKLIHPEVYGQVKGEM